ncbi:hypothetical protein DPMN_194753 [Dreissena polymorpha]|uniref:Reverse transcriptase n=1 Tax=Dreissena polymorpha TaxID=45954 RepID=A0A9D3Y5F9_DREPO|nr:hypothetical protein DPMN_194753 [Dreissena polymorpha]
MLLEFSKAFDKIPHKRLSIKQDNYGIRNFMKNCSGKVMLMRSPKKPTTPLPY